MTDPSISLEAANDLMDKWAAEAEAEAQEGAKDKSAQKKKKVKDALKAGAKQGFGGLGLHTRNLLEEID